ncbi:hypothetical protein RJ639_019187 [Escallonia herrerae]|uniref:Complex III subunit 9 n=1 Tax=Escallonia herrerae TaxID=1293975 RepID=A0AA88V721_9ASTE|nr:hypothetical protein RJ639_019187 [Escallonia herrerae]
MAATAQSKGRVLEGFYRVIMRRTPVYATFVIVGAFLGERAVDYGVHKLWEVNNIGGHMLLVKYEGLSGPYKGKPMGDSEATGREAPNSLVDFGPQGGLDFFCWFVFFSVTWSWNMGGTQGAFEEGGGVGFGEGSLPRCLCGIGYKSLIFELVVTSSLAILLRFMTCTAAGWVTLEGLELSWTGLQTLRAMDVIDHLRVPISEGALLPKFEIFYGQQKLAYHKQMINAPYVERVVSLKAMIKPMLWVQESLTDFANIFTWTVWYGRISQFEGVFIVPHSTRLVYPEWAFSTAIRDVFILLETSVATERGCPQHVCQRVLVKVELPHGLIRSTRHAYIEIA